jgi:hypothetical protein
MIEIVFRSIIMTFRGTARAVARGASGYRPVFVTVIGGEVPAL